MNYITDEELLGLRTDPDRLIEIIKQYRKEFDELSNIKRDSDNEEIIQDDEVVSDEEQVLK